MDSYAGLGMGDGDSDDSAIHQDSDDDNPEHDDDVDIGFRRHQYETFDDDRSKRPRSKEDAIYGVFMENDDDQYSRRKRGRTEGHKPAPMFVPAKKEKSAPMFVAAKKQEEPVSMFVAAKKQEEPGSMFVSAKSQDEPTMNSMFVASKQEGASGPETSNAESDPAANKFVTASKDDEKAKADSIEDDEKEDEEKQKEADKHFLSLLNKAKSRKRPPQGKQEKSMSAAMGIGMPSSFGRVHEERRPQPIQKDPNLAKWEKHTKGIGSRLLSKMGWSGKGGLGSNRRKLKTTATSATEEQVEKEPPEAQKGISRPVEVVVRPNNMGLGFGNFKEATQLKVNRQIEAEVRGIELPGKNKKKSEDLEMDDFQPKTASSAIPSTSELLSQKQWRKTRKQKAPKAKIIPYEELLEKQKLDGQTVIIDMRGPSSSYDTKTKKDENDDGNVPLAEELLHNVSFLLNTYENKLHSSANFAKSAEQKIASLKTDIQDMKKRRDEGSSRLAKMEKTIQIINQVDELTTRGDSDSANMLSGVQDLIRELEEDFSPQERQSLKFWEIIAPSLLSPIIKLQLDRWDPLEDDIAKSREVIDSIFDMELNASRATHADTDAVERLRESIVENQLIPRVKQVLGSSRWNPVQDIDIAIELYEYLEQKIQKVFRKSARVQDEDENHVFPGGDCVDDTPARSSQSLKREIMLDTIHPKIQTALSSWKPVLGKQSDGKSIQLEDRLDLWILPWMPHLDHPALIPNLLADCRRKLKSGISYLQKHTSTDIDFLQASVQLLKPWRRAFDAKDLQRIVSESITQRMARFLAKEPVRENVKDQKWAAFDCAFEIHALGLLSDIEFVSIIEGECLVNLASTTRDLLLEKASVSRMAQIYREWKMRTFSGQGDSTKKSAFADRSLQLMQADRQICGIFYTILRMLQLASDSDEESLEHINPPRANFRVVLARRMKEKKHALEDDFVRMETQSAAETDARIRLRRRNVTTATFREVVEEFANERGIVFRPKMGARSLKDGKQVYLCGETAIYLDGDVVFAQSGTEWRPVALEQLSEIAK
jgi:tuftelin-interacting protein 11